MTKAKTALKNWLTVAASLCAASNIVNAASTNLAIVAVIPTNAGKVNGVKNYQILQVGKSYPVSGTPANKDWIISDWTDGAGDVLSTNATFEYVDTDGTLTAHFVPNPFTNADLTGTYRALYYDTNDESVVRDDGYMP
jgi:hypothetical protein